MDDIIFEKYKDVWVFTAEGETANGMGISLEPVRIIKHGDNRGLRRALLESLASKPRFVPPEEEEELRQGPGLFARTFGLKNFRAYARDARCFYLDARSSDYFEIKEWPWNGKGGFEGPAVWSKRFPKTKIDALVEFLIAKTSGDAPAPVHARVTGGQVAKSVSAKRSASKRQEPGVG